MKKLNEFKEKADNIRKLYPKLQKHNDVWVNELYESVKSHQLITEFLTQTIQPIKTRDLINKEFNGLFSDIYVEDDSITISFLLKKHENNIEKINKKMISYGYFPAYIIGDKKSIKYSKDKLDILLKENSIYLKIKYEAKYDTEIINQPDHLYHLCPDISYKKIEIMGLTPKTQSKISTHPERIYLLEPCSNDEMEDIAFELWEKHKNRYLIKYYYMLLIDLEKLKIHLYKDPNFLMTNGGVWTYENIPPIYITLEKKILIQ